MVFFRGYEALVHAADDYNDLAVPDGFTSGLLLKEVRGLPPLTDEVYFLAGGLRSTTNKRLGETVQSVMGQMS
jgi:hypothetical protein